MLPSDFWLMCQGYIEHRDQKHKILRNVVYGAARYNASNTAFSKEAAKKISRQKFPWEKNSDGKPELIPDKQIEQMINAVGKKLDAE